MYARGEPRVTATSNFKGKITYKIHFKQILTKKAYLIVILHKKSILFNCGPQILAEVDLISILKSIITNGLQKGR